MIQPKASIRSDCFAFGNSSKSGCKALKVLDCIDCKFYKSNDDFKYQNYICTIRLNNIMAQKITKGSDENGG